MRSPRLWRNIGLAFLASGIAASSAAFLLPDAAVGNSARALLMIFGLTALVFGGGTALSRLFDAREQDALVRGEDVIARWRVDAETWRAFIAHDRTLDQESGGPVNELSIRDIVPADGIEVIVGKSAVQIDGSIHALPLRGTPEITHVELNTSRVRPSFVELRLYYPGGGQGASGVPRSATRTVLRFPVTAGALRDAEAVVAHYGGAQPGTKDSFHGQGDGTDPEDLSTCARCGFSTHKFMSHCSECGASMQSVRWSRRFGIGLFACGLFISAAIGAVIVNTAPLFLHPGQSIDGAEFSGSAAQGLLFLGIMGIVAAFGVMAMLYGLWQALSGKRDKRVIGFIVGLAALLWLIAEML